MTQWYPKLVEYDKDGWHPNPYVGREFHGVWGDFDVSITIDRNYVIGGTGYLQNPEEVGHGYAEKTKKSKSKTLTWRFVAPMVHDFAWAADPDFIHDMILGPNNVELHFFYLNNPDILENWKQLQGDTAKMLAFFNENIGEYPYKQYSVIQGGDGGMEYPMCTLITGEREYKSLFGVTAHELAHSWFHHLLGTNEAKYAWMDEGFTSFYDMLCESAILGTDDPYSSFYSRYYQLVNSGVEEPLTTHADRFQYNFAYGIASYSKGAVFLAQLGYIIGADNLRKTIKRYYEVFKFSHPTPNDFKRIAEKVSGIQLEWYLNDWVRTTNTIDYGVQQVEEKGQKTKITLERIGNLPMPVEAYVETFDGSVFYYYIPLQMMRGEKSFLNQKVSTLSDWSWANPTYHFEIDNPLADIKVIQLNPTGLKADVNPNNDIYMIE
jgi:aminopeptidase N